MKAVIQRVDRASVSVDGNEVSRIGGGLLVLLGVEKGDSEKDADFLLDKINHLRIFEDGEGKIQLFLRVNELNEERVTFFNRMFDLGDFVQASGVMMRTKTGEATRRCKLRLLIAIISSRYSFD